MEKKPKKVKEDSKKRGSKMNEKYLKREGRDEKKGKDDGMEEKKQKKGKEK